MNTERKLRQELADVWAMLDAERRARASAPAPEPVAWCALTPNGTIAYFDGKPMVMPGPVGNALHTVPLYAATPPQAAAPAAVGEPQGWKLVPVEPTRAMVRSGWSKHPSAFGDEYIPAMWEAMLAASPAPTGLVRGHQSGAVAEPTDASDGARGDGGVEPQGARGTFLAALKDALSNNLPLSTDQRSVLFALASNRDAFERALLQGTPTAVEPQGAVAWGCFHQDGSLCCDLVGAKADCEFWRDSDDASEKWTVGPLYTEPQGEQP